MLLQTCCAGASIPRALQRLTRLSGLRLYSHQSTYLRVVTLDISALLSHFNIDRFLALRHLRRKVLSVLRLSVMRLGAP